MATLKSVRPYVLADIRAGNTVVLQSDPGVGKTDWTDTLISDLRASEPGINWGVCKLFMATQSEVGFTGLPWKGEKVWPHNGSELKLTVTDPAVPQWCLSTEGKPMWLYDKVLIVVEEWGQGTAESKRAGAELLRARGVYPFYAPAGSACIALTNVDKNDGVTKEFDFVINRAGYYRINFDVDVWLEWADKPYEWNGKPYLTSPFTKAWLKTHASETVMAGKPDKQGPWPTPRSIAAVDRFCQEIDPTMSKLPVDDGSFMEAIEGKIGAGATQLYVNDLQFMTQLPQIEDVIADPKGTPWPNRADLQMLMSYTLAGRVNASDLAPVVSYMERSPTKDMQVTFISALLRRDYKLVKETPILSWQNRNSALMSAIQALSK